MKLTILGSASSQGIPQPLCFCKFCIEAKGKDFRTRSSYLLELSSGHKMLLDASPDWRQQNTDYRFDFEYLFLSHKHRDHLAGIEDIRLCLEAHHKRRTRFQKQRAVLIGKTLNKWLSNGKHDARWEESLLQAFQQLTNRGYFKKYVLKPYKRHKLEENVFVTYLRGKHSEFYCGALIIEDNGKKIVYLADISEFNAKLVGYLESLMPDLVIVHLPFFYKPTDLIEIKKHSGVEVVKDLPGKHILLSHFSHSVSMHHKKLSKKAIEIDSRFVVAYDGQEIDI